MAFRKDFIWGAATASYQIEGGAYEGGRGLSVWDRFSHTPGKVFDGHTGDVSCDHYHLMEEDLDLMTRLGIKNYRFSVSWPRLLPEGTGKVNQTGVDFYNRLLDGLIARGIRPFMTLFHWDYPLELLRRGGWENPDSPKWFRDYAALCARAFGNRCKDFIPINEPQCFIGLGHVTGEHAPGFRFPRAAAVPMMHHVHLANAGAIDVLRDTVPGAAIGYAPCGNPMIPFTAAPEDIEAARRAYFDVSDEGEKWVWSVSMWSDPVVLGAYPEAGVQIVGKHLPHGWENDMDKIRRRLDFYGQNIYQGELVRACDNEKGYERVRHPVGIAKTASEWPVTPEALYWGPRFLYERYKTPFIITESGMAGLDAPYLDGKVHDSERVNYLHRYIAAYKRAAEDGVDARGYFQWSLLDNFEWARGYADRFGMVYVDYATLKRTPKDSAFWYKTVMETNAENL